MISSVYSSYDAFHEIFYSRMRRYFQNYHPLIPFLLKPRNKMTAFRKWTENDYKLTHFLFIYIQGRIFNTYIYIYIYIYISIFRFFRFHLTIWFPLVPALTEVTPRCYSWKMTPVSEKIGSYMEVIVVANSLSPSLSSLTRKVAFITWFEDSCNPNII